MDHAVGRGRRRLALNGGIMWGLHREKDHDLNIRAAFVHMLGDAVSSVGIIAGAIAIHFTGLAVIDPVLSVLIGILIVWTAWDIIQESLNVLLEGLPRGMELNEVTGAMRQIDGVIDVHDLHIWSLGSSAHALSCHVLIEDMPPSESNAILQRINDVLCKYEIHHTTVQFEHTKCALSDAPCNILVTSASRTRASSTNRDPFFGARPRIRKQIADDGDRIGSRFENLGR